MCVCVVGSLSLCLFSLGLCPLSSSLRARRGLVGEFHRHESAFFETSIFVDKEGEVSVLRGWVCVFFRCAWQFLNILHMACTSLRVREDLYTFLGRTDVGTASD